MNEIWEPCNKKFAKKDKLVRRYNKNTRNEFKVWCFDVQRD